MATGRQCDQPADDHGDSPNRQCENGTYSPHYSNHVRLYLGPQLVEATLHLIPQVIGAGL